MYIGVKVSDKTVNAKKSFIYHHYNWHSLTLFPASFHMYCKSKGMILWELN